jgi:AraC-like DNA-binding protein
MLNIKSVIGKAAPITQRTEEHRIIQVIEGEGEVKTARRSYSFFPGLIIILPPRLEYSLITEDECRLIVIDGSFAKLYFLKDVYCLADNLYNEGRMLAEAMVRSSRENEDYKMTLFDAYIKYISLNVNSYDSFNAIIHSITTKIESSYSDTDFDLMKLISSQGYATDYIRSKFLKITGMTPIEYLTNVRINNAKTMLRIFKDVSVQEIAARCGYFDAAYFTRCFKRIAGVSPREYRERL